MPPTVPPKPAEGSTPAGRRVVVGCLTLSAVGVVGSVGLALLPMAGWQIGTGSPLQLLPSLAASLGLVGGALCLAAVRSEVHTAAAPGGADIPASALNGLQTVVRELGSLLLEERSRVNSLQEICSAGMRDARTISTRVENLTEAAMDAETRLAAGVTRTAEAALHVQNALPEIAEMVRRGIADALTARLKAEAEASLQLLRTAMAEAAGQMTGLGETATAVRRDVTALETAGREITVASATVVSRLGGAVGHIEAAVTALPEAAAGVTQAAEQAAQTAADAFAGLQAAGAALTDTAKAAADEAMRTMAEAVAGVRTEAAALTETGQAVQQAAQDAARTLQASGQSIQATSEKVISQVGDAVAHIDAVAVYLPEAAEAVTNAAEQAARAMADGSATLSADVSALAAAAQDVHQVAETLQNSGQAIEIASSKVVSLVGDAVSHIDAALAEVAPAVATVTAAAAYAAQALQEATAALHQDGVALAACAGDTQAVLQQQGEALRATAEAFAESGHQTVAHVTQSAQTAAAQLAALIADADVARQGAASLTDLTATLENVAASLVDGACKLDAAGERVAAVGESTAERIDADTARSEAISQTLQGLTADMAAAAEHLRDETAALTAATQQMAAAGDTATLAVTGIAVRAESSAALLDATGRKLGERIDQLAAVTQVAETHAGSLPDVTSRLADAAARLGGLAETWPPEALLTALPETIERLNAATRRLAELDALSIRLERVVGGVAAEEAREPLATLAGLSADIGESVRRVEAALADHDGIWPSLQTSMSQVQAAAVELVEAAALERAKPSIDVDAAPAALATTLRHFDELDSQSQTLLQQTEALAEAVLGGRAPGLPPLLADRTPALLAGIDVTTRRLRSVATALALASDGATVIARRA